MFKNVEDQMVTVFKIPAAKALEPMTQKQFSQYMANFMNGEANFRVIIPDWNGNKELLERYQKGAEEANKTAFLKVTVRIKEGSELWFDCHFELKKLQAEIDSDMKKAIEEYKASHNQKVA